MPTPWQRAWPILKLLFAAAILVAVGWQFARYLRDLDLHELEFRPAWLALSAVLYLAFLGSSCIFWRRLLHHFGHRPPAVAIARAYYVSQLAKYVPGKAWTLWLRGGMVETRELRLALAIVTSLYEVFTTMAAGALIAVVAFLLQPPPNLMINVHPELTIEVNPVFAGLIFVVLCAIPLLPVVFNRIVGRYAKKLQTGDAEPFPQIAMGMLLQGLAITACGWCLMGLSVWASLAAVLPQPPALNVSMWLQCLGTIGLAYVGGFLVFVLPNGVGPRDLALLKLLAFAGPETHIAAVVLVMRLTWTVAEVIIAAALYPLAKKVESHSEPRP
jgi:uncharacterized membrane protein YbhN (UPF0104 family)